MQPDKITQADLLLIIGDQHVTICALRSEVRKLTAMRENVQAPADEATQDA